MDFSTIGSLRTFTKNLEMQVKFDEKKDSGKLTAHPTSERDLIQQQVDDEHKNDRLKEIMRKVESGAKLTKEEKAYLKEKAPETYDEIEAREREQKAYEQALKRCKTKEDVQRLKASRLGASLSKLKEVENNPHIPLEKKLKIFMDEKMKLDKFEESARKFARSGELAKLPTEAEAAKAEKEQKEAEEARRNPEAEKPDPAEKPAPGPDQTAEARPDKEEKPEKPAEPKRESRPAFEQESPEARKVRRAKAKAAYTHPEEAPMETPAASLDTRG